MQYIDKTVAEVSPNLYAAAKQANLGTNEVTQVEQMSFTMKQNRELAKLPADQARAQYDKLDAGVQAQLKYLFKNAEYLKAAPTAADRVKGAIGDVFKVAASPLIALFKLGGAYNQVINEPYKVIREVAQGADPFAYKTWKSAWDGKELYDNGALKEATDYYGQYDVTVAKGLLAGKTPGEILQAYGTVDNNILGSIKKAYNDPTKFQEVMDNVKAAQISPGRDIVRMLNDKPPADGGMHGEHISGARKFLSGAIDFAYQVALDPLTWLTGGANKLVPLGERIANSVTIATKSGISAERAVGDAFLAHPELTKLWDDQLGPLLKKYSTAKGDEARGNIYRQIAQEHPGYASIDAIKALTTKDVHLPEGVVDAASAKKYFENAQNLHLMLAGRVDGVTYMRNGVATARTNRLFMDGMRKSLDNVFNFNRGEEELKPLMEPIYKAFLDSGEATDRLAQAVKGENSDMAAVLEANKSISGWKNGKFYGKMAARSAAGLEVRIGEAAGLTAGNFTTRARQILPRDMADALTQRFLSVPEEEQIVILRNLDAATMYSMGLGGDVNGTKLIETILREKYGDLSGFAATTEAKVNPATAEHAPIGLLKQGDEGITASVNGPIHPYQSTKAVGSLPYDEIGSMAWNIKSKKNLINAIGGATQGHNSRRIVDAWSILTLLPRLGIRSAIDEATMYVLTAPSKDLMSFASHQGNKMSNMSRAFTGSAEATGPIKLGLQKVFGKLPKTDFTEYIGKKFQIDPEHALTIAARKDAMQAYADKHGIDSALLDTMQKREAIADHVRNIYGRYLDPETMDYLLQAHVHSPDALHSMAQSLIAHSALSGKYSQEVLASTITPSMLDEAFKEMGVQLGKKNRRLIMSQLAEREQALAHYEKFVKVFVGNKAKIGSGVKERTYLNPTEIFFNNNAIKSSEDMKKALDAGMEAVGFKYNALSDTWEVADEAVVKNYLGLSSTTTALRAQGMSDADVAKSRLYLMFNDMQTVFHGDPEKYNEALFNLVKKNKAELFDAAVARGYKEASHSQAIAKISLDDFHDLTLNNRIKGEITTAIDFDNFDAENVFRKYGNMAMESMDRQVTGIFRQPAIMVTYTQLRKKYAGIEREFADQQYMAMGGLWETPGVAKNKKLLDTAKTIAQKRFTEIATRDAADIVLKFADNPAIRSNAAFASRTVGRYYRATEDFYRRIYRLKDVSPRVLYRTRLVHLGLSASGMIHKDQNGDPYIVMPMDNIIFKATDGTIRALTGKTGYSQPVFNDLTLKLTMMNPSFQQDAGLPTLSGPIAGLGVIAVKDFLGTVPGKIPFIGQFLDEPSKLLADKVDTFALGNVGNNIDVVRATVPAGVQKLWAILPFDEKSRQEVTAAQQAMAYNASHGLFLNANSTAQEKLDYLKNLRISAHNVVALRTLLGLIGPVTPTAMEDKGLPDYLKNVGITGLRPEFFDILNGISLTNKGDVIDPYEQALATFMGKYPGKLIYTVSRDEKQTRVVVKNTDGLKNWAIANQDMINKYGESAYIFAPQAGKFNAATYNYVQAAGLIKNKTLEKYYDDLLVAQDKQTYYDIARTEKAQLETISDPQLRTNLIASATAARDALKSGNPLLNPALIGTGNAIGTEQIMLKNVEQIIADPATKIEAATRKRMSVAVKLVRDYITFCSDPALKNAVNNGKDIKMERRIQLEANLNDLSLGDLYVSEANRAIFKSILNFYSRDSYRSYKETM